MNGGLSPSTDDRQGSPGGTAGRPPLCFVLMPYGVRADNGGRNLNFERLYEEVIEPAIGEAGLAANRADKEILGGLIHKPMFERLILCSFAVADLTLANANVFYELGVRHAVRPHSTVLLYARAGQRLPFDIEPLRALPYDVTSSGELADPQGLRQAITERLVAARDPVPDSPIYQLLDGFVAPDLRRLRTDAFREVVTYAETVRKKLVAARRAADGRAEVAAVHGQLRPLDQRESGVLVDLLLAYRDVGDTEAMVTLVAELPAHLTRTVQVREQLAFALNRQGRRDEAEDVLRAVVEEFGPSSETYGLLGRVYRDRWEEAGRRDDPAAPAYLAKAAEAYRRGFESDWRDPYPGINAVTLLEIQEPGQETVLELAPVVRYSVLRRISKGSDTYWDHATLTHLAFVLSRSAEAKRHLADALAARSEPWMRESTAHALQLLADDRQRRGIDSQALRQAQGKLRGRRVRA